VIHARHVPLGDPRIEAMLQEYMREWSALLPMKPGPDGAFAYPHRHRYVDDDHEAVIFVEDERPVGFALARRVPGAWQVQEFFVSPAERRRGVGARALTQLCARHPGPWTLTVRPENPAALAFWRRVLGRAPTEERGGDGVLRRRFLFQA